MRIIDALRDADVRFLVVGGVAVVLHGHPRMTADLDLVVDLQRDNLQRALAALGELGLQPRLPVRAEQFADPELRRQWVEERNLMVFSMHDPTDPRREVDIFASLPFPWKEMHADAIEIVVGSTVIPVVGRHHLISMKRQAGRAQDLADIEVLTRLEGGD
ncbi:MAG: nucleotidyl transferase AbiEii/AbiGii toxin family protein [Euzebya sp.]